MFDQKDKPIRDASPVISHAEHDDEEMVSHDDIKALGTVTRDVDFLSRGKKRERTHELFIEDVIFENFGEYDFERQRRFSMTVQTLLRDFIPEDYLPLPPQLENVYLCSKKEKFRIVDLCAIIGDTLLMIECDEDGHRAYDQQDESKRVRDIWEACGGKLVILIRINPTLKGVPMNIKKSTLITEVRLQIQKIKNGTAQRDRFRYTEIKLYYPEVDVRVEELIEIPVDVINKDLTLNDNLPGNSMRESETESVVIDPDHLKWFQSTFCYLANRGKFYDYDSGILYTKKQFFNRCVIKETIVQYVDKWTKKMVKKSYESARLWIKDKSQIEVFFDLSHVPGGDRVIPHPLGSTYENLLNVHEREKAFKELIERDPERSQGSDMFFQRLKSEVHEKTFTETFLKSKLVPPNGMFAFDWDRMNADSCFYDTSKVLYELYKKECENGCYISTTMFASKMKDLGLIKAQKKNKSDKPDVVWVGFKRKRGVE